MVELTGYAFLGMTGMLCLAAYAYWTGVRDGRRHLTTEVSEEE